MEVELYVDPNAPGYIDFIEDLKSELAALKGLNYSVDRVPAPEKTLSGEHDVLKFIFDHGDRAAKLGIALLELIRAVMDRRRDRRLPDADDKKPIAIFRFGDQKLSYPASDTAEKRFAERIRKRPQRTAKQKPKKRKTGRRPPRVRKGKR